VQESQHPPRLRRRARQGRRSDRSGPAPGRGHALELAAALEELWGHAAPATWNQRRAATASFLAWCAKNSTLAPTLPASAERRPEHPDETRAIPHGAIERLLTRHDIPLREKTLWRMLYETAARAGEILGLNIEDLDLDANRAVIISKGGTVEYVYWATGTARLLPRLITGRTRGPLFLSHRRPAPARRPATRDLCLETGLARLGYDRARVLLDQHTSPGPGSPGWDLHQLRHSAATTLGDTSLQLIMAKTRHRNPRTVMRYIKPGALNRPGFGGGSEPTKGWGHASTEEVSAGVA